MKKILRSFIHENFPFELRVEIELLSRRRDIFNDEKQDELFKILRKYDIPNIVPLGPGTNRYAFKLNGFVIKVATDNDGKIDNFKEFKMSKRLYPHVAKTYEVSDNGTLLIAEYIEPFSSYGEMLEYADQIRDILKKLSAVYLIGDVGITKKNYANWGKRIGSDEPVCLDFAYVYDVKSELFLCKACKNNSMLIPNNDFTKLICPAPGCGHEYEFEEIRARLGNDIHNHEIGDLSEEGYRMYESNVETELTDTRSNYLVKETKKPKPEKEIPKEEVILDDFYLETNDGSNVVKNITTRGGKTMNNYHGVTLQAKAYKAEEVPEREDDVIVVQAVAFSGEIEDDNEAIAGEVKVEATASVPDDLESIIDDIAGTAEQQKSEVKNEPVPEPEEEPKVAVATVAETVEEDGPVENDAENDEKSLFDSAFINEIYMVPLRVAQKISDTLYHAQIFDEVKNDITLQGKKKLYPGEFYNNIRYAINHAILEFCKFEVGEGINKKNGKPCKHYYAPKEMEGTEYTDTLIFMQRFFHEHDMFNAPGDAEAIDMYHEKFNDYLGIQNDIIPFIGEQIHAKFTITDKAVNKIIECLIEHGWIQEYSLRDQLQEEIKKDPIEVNSEDDVRKALAEAAATGVVKTEGTVDLAKEDPVPEPLKDEPEFSGDMIGENTEAEGDEEYDEQEYDEDGGYRFLSADIYREENLDVIRVNSPGAFGDVSIPIYVNLDDVDGSQLRPSMVDDRNGYWDWLIHFNPDKLIRTNDPDKYFEYNNIDYDNGLIRFVIVDEEETGDFIVGMYCLYGVFDIDDEMNSTNVTEDIELMTKINNIIVDNIGTTAVSHLQMTLTVDPDLIVSEKDFDFYGMIYNDQGGYMGNESTERNDDMVDNMAAAEPTDENEQAAIDALFGEVAQEPTEPTEETQAEQPQDSNVLKPVHRSDYQ